MSSRRRHTRLQGDWSSDVCSSDLHMNMKAHPPNVKASRAGHSIGRWEGDTLVVDTVGFLPGFITTPVRHSNQLHVVERFRSEERRVGKKCKHRRRHHKSVKKEFRL